MEQREIINTITTVLEEYLSSSTENGFLRLKKLEELLELRQKYPFWLHVGGAWGGAVARISHEHCVNFYKYNDITICSGSIPSYENHTQCSPKASRSYHACSVAEARCIDYYSTLLRASHPRQPRLVRNPG